MTAEEVSAEAAARHYYRTVDESSPSAVVALFHPAAIYRRPGYQPMVGHDALLAFYGGERVIADGRHEITSIIVSGDQQVAVEGRFAGRLRDGRDVEIGFADFFTIRDGLIVDRATYFEAAAV